MFKSPCEICLSFLGTDIYCYGLIMGIAVLVGTFFSDFVRKKYFTELSEKDCPSVNNESSKKEI